MKEILNGNLHFRDAFIMNNIIYFSAVEINGLFSQKREQSSVDLISKFSREEEIQDNLHSKIIKYEDKFYFIPLESKGISIFDINDLTIRTVIYDNSKNTEIISAFLIEKDILLIPMNIDSPFLLFHTVDESYERLEKLEEGIWKIIDKEKMWFDTFSSIVHENKIYMILPNTNILLICDLEDWSIVTEKFDGNMKFNSVTYLNGKIYLSSIFSSKIVEWDILTQKRRLFAIKEWENEEIKEIVITAFQNRLFVISSKEVLILDTDKGSCVNKMYMPDDFNKRLTKYRLIAGIKKVNDALWIFSASGTGTICIRDNNLELITTKATDEMLVQISNNKKERLKRNFRTKMEKDLLVCENQFEGADIGTLIWCCLEKEY